MNTPIAVKTRFRTSEAARVLEAMGYVWLPGAREWKLCAGIPYRELPLAPCGWYERWQTTAAGALNSSDGFACVIGHGRVAQFNLDMRPLPNYTPSLGYEDRTVFRPVRFAAIANREYA